MLSPSVPSGPSGPQNHEPQLPGNVDSPELAQNVFVLEPSDVFIPYASVTSPSENLLTQ